jgi:hypothetical protein
VDLGEGATNSAGDLTTNFWVTGPTNPFIEAGLITIKQPQTNFFKYVVSRSARRLTFESPTTTFWSTNDGNKVVNYDSLQSELDQIVILQANPDHNRTKLLQQNWVYNILGRSIVDVGLDAGLPADSKVIVLPRDDNGDRIPDNLSITYPATQGLADILNPSVTVVVPAGETIEVTLPILYIPGAGDIKLVSSTQPMGDITITEDDLEVSNTIQVSNSGGAGPEGEGGSSGESATVVIQINDYVYLTRQSLSDVYQPAITSTNSVQSYVISTQTTEPEFALWTRRPGRDKLNFMWTHSSPRYYLVDPSPTNIIDLFVITKGYFTELRRWIQDPTALQPQLPTPLDLRTSYASLLRNKMVSDTAVVHPGRMKLLFGDKSQPALRGVFKVVRSEVATLTDNQVKSTVVSTIRNFFDITQWEFGETFYVTELISAIHNALKSEISSVVIVPTGSASQFGDLFQIYCQEDEIFYADINIEDVEVVTSYTPTNIRLNN